uniref:LIM zinc-binding domain-containing protein n=1 Tax=Haemonchus contortus TaxID=6289 RepID=A0A7I4Y2C8_HAECO|nr:Zinc finger domain containing protein [Haemonchus contortus]
MNQCGYCERKIEHEPALFARGRLWHVNHLLCDECGCRIQEEEKFEEREGFIVCRHCYLNGRNPRCAGCFDGIDVKYVEAADAVHHRTCFQCTICLQPLSRHFVENDRGLPMHRQCYWKELLYKEIVTSFTSNR